MRIVVAPDSYKGSISALGVAEAVEEGFRRVFPDAEVIKAPIADGGEGTVEALVSSTGGHYRQTMVSGPLGAPVEAVWGVLGDGRTAVIEMAAASGLPLIGFDQRDPLRASTFGTGQLLKAVLDAGLTRVILGIGGSATNDGGSGFASALGVRFLDDEGRELPPGGAALARLARVDLSGLDPKVAEMEIMVACDVDNPLCGPRGASAVFGPQKGATPEMVETLDKALGHYGRLAAEATGRDIVDTAGAGAAGGLGAGLMFFTPAKLRPGIDIVLEAIDFDKMVEGAALVITGEGRTDFQTAFGKAPVGVARIAKKRSVPVVCLSGGLGEGYKSIYAQGIDAALATPDGPMSLEECLKAGAPLVAEAGERLARLIKIGQAI
ncbi:glycerate kinase [Deltaproteobacteria bacterium Smac51]|nr:glycerate kinase [Deltaproteobacteria bacterium Smac51]